MSDGTHLRPGPLEIASGVPFGVDGFPVLLSRVGRIGPREALRLSLLPALQRPPCVVAFSGGRDSSALLALAVDVARREGLPLPVAVTLRFPGEPAADESQWQEAVVHHLALQDWVRLEFADELDYVGPWARRVLREHGVLWPANTHVHLPVLEQARGGSLVDGVDGDSVFRWGFAGVSDLLRLRARPSRAALSNLRTRLSPPPTRRARLLGSGPFLSWLTPDADAEARRLLAADMASEPASYVKRLSWYVGSRHAGMLQWTTGLLARGTGTLLVRPFLDQVFLGAWAQETGSWGFRGRTAAMRQLFGDLLPSAVVERQDKAMFWHYWGAASRALAADWRGEGVDPSYVDHGLLRAAWASREYPTPDHRSALLLQSVLLARLGEHRQQGVETP